MSSSSSPGGSYEVYNSGVIVQAFLELQRQATREGQGQDLIRAARHVYERLRDDPNNFGEPLYRLPNLRMQIRCAAVKPLENIHNKGQALLPHWFRNRFVNEHPDDQDDD